MLCGRCNQMTLARRGGRYPVWAPTVAAGLAGRLRCAARSEGAPRNSLRSLRSLRSDNLGESEDEARCARGHESCAPRRRICRCRRTPTHGVADAPRYLTKRMPRWCWQGCGWAGRGALGRRRAAQLAKGHRDAPKRDAMASMSSSERGGAAQQRRARARARGGAALGQRAAQGTSARRAEATAVARPGPPTRIPASSAAARCAT